MKPIRTNQLTDPWIWKSQAGAIVPSAMNTNHLFNTLMMIWNHSVPDEYRFYPYKPWSFSVEKYPDWYMKEAVHHLGKELLTRDLDYNKLKKLEDMQNRIMLMNRKAIKPEQKLIPFNQPSINSI